MSAFKVMVSITSEQPLKIGEVAAQSGLSIKTIRYYEDIGLLTPTVERSHSGYRLFKPYVLNRLDFVKRAKSLGLTLNEIREILAIRDQGQLPCEEVKQHLEGKVASITEQIAALETLRSELQDLLVHWQDYPSCEDTEPRICPNLQSES